MSWPATKLLKSLLIFSLSLSSWKRFFLAALSQRLEWTWPEQPGRAVFHLAMKVGRMPKR